MDALVGWDGWDVWLLARRNAASLWASLLAAPSSRIFLSFSLMPSACELPDAPALSGDVSDMSSSELGGSGGALELEVFGRVSVTRSEELDNPKLCS